MKITVKELKNLIREAMYQGPGTAFLKTNVPVYARNPIRKELDSLVTKLCLVNIPENSTQYRRLRPGMLLDTATLEIYFINDRSGRVKDSVIVHKQEFRDLLRSLGFSEKAISDVDFRYQDRGVNTIQMSAGVKFVAEWQALFGDETCVDLT
jgi:hypothetical protein